MDDTMGGRRDSGSRVEPISIRTLDSPPPAQTPEPDPEPAVAPPVEAPGPKRSAPRRRPPARRPPPRSRSNPLLSGEAPAASPERTSGAAAPRPAQRSKPRSEPKEEAPTKSHERAVCTVALCPICTLLTALDEVKPELAEHLLLAGREVLMAIKAVIDSRLQSGSNDDGGKRGKGSQPKRLERITIE